MKPSPNSTLIGELADSLRLCRADGTAKALLRKYARPWTPAVCAAAMRRAGYTPDRIDRINRAMHGRR